MKKIENFTVNPNVVYMLPPEPIDETTHINLSQEILPRCLRGGDIGNSVIVKMHKSSSAKLYNYTKVSVFECF